MKIEHLAIWASDLEKMKEFYTRYFGGTSGEKYHNPNKNFTSYFISFSDGCRLELMHRPDIAANPLANQAASRGLTHFAFTAGSREAVDALTERLRKDGYRIVGEARTTGDGYYESIVADPEGNSVEIVA